MPTWQGFLTPVLAVLRDGEVRDRTWIADAAIDVLALSEEQRAEQLPKGGSQAVNRAGWALSELSRGAAITRTSRAHYRITDVGQQLLADHPEGITEDDVKALPAWSEHEARPRAVNGSQTTRRQRATVPGTERTFAGRQYALANTGAGYVYKRDSDKVHVADCPHGLLRGLEPRSRDDVIGAWKQAPDAPLDTVTGPGWCVDCMAVPVRPGAAQDETPDVRERIVALGRAARSVLIPALTEGRSATDPSRTIWTAETADALQHAILDTDDTGRTGLWSKLEGQLAGQSRDVVLLAVEFVYLQQLALVDVHAATKSDRLRRMLAWLPDAPALPEELDEGLDVGGVFRGGMAFQIQLWNQLLWLARFVVTWDSADVAEREAALSDPWTFRAIVARTPQDQPAIRNALLFLTWPDTFETTVSDDQKRTMRDALAGFLDGPPSGDDGEAVDRDLHTIRTTVQGQNGGRYVDWYASPWRERWQPDNDGQRAWAVRARPRGGELIARWVSEGFVSLPADHLPAVPAGADRATVQRAVAQGYDHVDYPERQQLTDDFFAFLSRIQEGDVLVARDGDDVWLGQTEGPAERTDDPSGRLRIPVTWAAAPVAEGRLPAGLGDRFSSPRSVIDLTEALDGLKELAEATGDEDPDDVPAPTESVTRPAESLGLRRATPQLASALHIDQAWLDRFIALFEQRKQIILYGPPGTGKTYLARAIAHHVAAPEAVRIVQFHPSYAYEDFFEGIRPALEDGAVGFRLVPGPLRSIASAALNDPDHPYVLVIDEINRANLAKVFGELYFLLEYRDEQIALPYSPGKDFRLPRNLFFVGTMNTADRSIALVDSAIRRRFAFVEMHPDTPPVRGLLGRWLADRGADPGRAALLDALNARLGDELRDFQIGPSYLMRPDAATADGLERIWEYDILPLLEEHLYGQADRRQVHDRFGLEALRREIAAAGSGDGDAGTEDEAGAGGAEADDGPGTGL